jgi:hypothetical protein
MQSRSRLQPVLDLAIHFDKGSQIVGPQTQRKLIDDAVDETFWGKVEAVVANELGRGNEIDFAPAIERHTDAAVFQRFVAYGAIMHSNTKWFT